MRYNPYSIYSLKKKKLYNYFREILLNSIQINYGNVIE